MAYLNGAARTRYTRRMFAQIADRYDRLNRIISLGLDRSWRRELASLLSGKEGSWILDAGAGTGDVAMELSQANPQQKIVATDLTFEMAAQGKKRQGAQRVFWVVADVHHLPFRSEIFAGIGSAFLLRNVGDLNQTICELHRLLQPGGCMAALDSTPPRRGIFSLLAMIYLNMVIPLLGFIFGRNRTAYEYLAATTSRFLTADQLSERFMQEGYVNVAYRQKMFGMISIIWGEKEDCGQKQRKHFEH